MRLKHISRQSVIHVVKANIETEFFVAMSLLCAALLQATFELKLKVDVCYSPKMILQK